MAKQKQRKLWDVWREGTVWMVQGPRGCVDFFYRKTAVMVATRGKEISAQAAQKEGK